MSVEPIEASLQPARRKTEGWSRPILRDAPKARFDLTSQHDDPDPPPPAGPAPRLWPRVFPGL